MAMVGFDASVNAIRKHRLANPAIVVKHKLATDVGSIATELETYTRMRLGIPEPSFFQPAPSSQPAPLLAAAAGIKRAAQGTGVILDWLMSGGAPVASELAHKRAGICVQCPKNVEGSWFTVAPAELIRSTLEARKDLSLRTSYDDQLKSCDVCKCLMRLKVWTPLDFILGKTSPEVMSEFPAHCWIAKRDQ